jgi:hypothetical protein
VAGIVLAALAAVVAIWWAPAVEESFSCGDAIGGLVGLVAFVAIAGGVGIIVFALARAIRGHAWSSLLVAFPGVTLFALGFVLGDLYNHAWGVEGCQD